MANPTISQIKIGSTTYDICDFVARSTWWGFHKIECTTSKSLDFTTSDLSGRTVTWVKDITPSSGWQYWGYAEFRTGSTEVYMVHRFESGAVFGTIKSSNSGTKPSATQLYAQIGL